MPICVIQRLRVYIFKETSPVDQDRSFLYWNDLTINTAIIGSSHPSNEFAPRLLKHMGTLETVLIELKALNVTIVTTLIFYRLVCRVDFSDNCFLEIFILSTAISI